MGLVDVGVGVAVLERCAVLLEVAVFRGAGVWCFRSAAGAAVEADAGTGGCEVMGIGGDEATSSFPNRERSCSRLSGPFTPLEALSSTISATFCTVSGATLSGRLRSWTSEAFPARTAGFRISRFNGSAVSLSEFIAGDFSVLTEPGLASIVNTGCGCGCGVPFSVPLATCTFPDGFLPCEACFGCGDLLGRGERSAVSRSGRCRMGTVFCSGL